MAVDKTLLDELRSQSQVDCDTLDNEVAETLGPFVDCTSNQAIALGELQKAKNAQLLRDSIQKAKELQSKYPHVSLEELAVEIASINLSARMTPHLLGYAHIQTNPMHSYSTELTISDAHRIVDLYTSLHEFPANRVCIKIPSTVEGLRACAELEKSGIATLATTLFSMEQAAFAAHVGCTYIAPYINGLKVHFDPSYVDDDKGFALARAAQKYYGRIGARTKVLPASLTSVNEVIRCAGVDHITIAPALLAEMANTKAGLASAMSDAPAPVTLDRKVDEDADMDYAKLVKDESKYRLAFSLAKDGRCEKKLTDAIVIFCRMQRELEMLVKGRP